MRRVYMEFRQDLEVIMAQKIFMLLPGWRATGELYVDHIYGEGE